MAKQEEAYRAVERKYKKMWRQAKRQRFRKKLPAGILAVVLLLAVFLFFAFQKGIFSRESLRYPENTSVLIEVLDVGQGDASLIRTAESTVLIDSGEWDQGMNVVQMLKERGITKIDYLINSHPHSDHIGGFADVMQYMEVGEVYLPDFPASLTPTGTTYLEFLEAVKEHNIPLHIPENGTVLELGTAKLTFLSVDNSGWDDLNNCSLVCRLDCEPCAMLFCGDLEREGEEAMLAAGLITPATVLKCGHHGSNTSCSEAFLQAVHPQAAVISVGEGNSYGHPAQKCLDRLNAVCDTVFRTDLDGTVCIAVQDGKMKITTQKTR